MKAIKFLNSPVGFGLGYHIGEIAILNENQMDELVQLGYAEEVEFEETIIGISSEEAQTEEIETAIKVETKTIKKAVK